MEYTTPLKNIETIQKQMLEMFLKFARWQERLLKTFGLEVVLLIGDGYFYIGRVMIIIAFP